MTTLESEKRRLSRQADPDANRRYQREYYARNRERMTRLQREKRAAQPGLNRKYARQTKYKLTPADIARMLEQQGGVCDVCKCPLPLGKEMVDHCHRTGKVRGLLCNKCNSGLGKFGDSVEGLQSAIDYLKRTA